MEKHKFSWWLHSNGYEVIKDGRLAFKDDWYLVYAKVRGEQRNYIPPIGLCMTFSRIPPTKPGIIRFANTYGILGVKLTDIMETTGKLPVWAKSCESLEFWFNEIAQMRLVLDLWKIILAEETKALSKYVWWDGDRVFYQNPYLANKDFRQQEIKGYFAPGNIILPGLSVIQAKINDRLNETYSGSKANLIWDTNEERLVLRTTATNLHGFLWTEVAKLISEKKVFKECNICGKYFEIKPPFSRKTKVFCSAACRQKAYRKRLGEANK